MSDVDVIICVHSMDRWSDIIEAICSLQQQLLAPKLIIMVVDHNTSLLQSLKERFSDLLIVENTGPRGLSGARNTGLGYANSKYVGFLDDDARADANFLNLLVWECSQDNVLAATARVEPLWEGSVPRWLPRSFYWTLGCSHYEIFDGSVTVRNVSGGAAVYKREIFDETLLFSSDLGRKGGKSLISCEETDLCIKAAKRFKNGKFVINMNAVVHHRVPVERATILYFIRRCYAEGVSKCRLSINHGGLDVLMVERQFVRSVFRFRERCGVPISQTRSFYSSTLFLQTGASFIGLMAALIGFGSEMARNRFGWRKASAGVGI